MPPLLFLILSREKLTEAIFRPLAWRRLLKGLVGRYEDLILKLGIVLTGCTYQTFDVVKDIVPPRGAILEFGVRNGHSIHCIADMFPDRTVYGFDTFEGLPEDWHDVPAGMYSAGGRIPQVPNNVELVLELFDQTLPELVQNMEEPIAFMNIDCDLYSSTATVFANVGHLIIPGTIIVFDEYIGYEHWREGEFKAFQEWVSGAM